MSHQTFFKRIGWPGITLLVFIVGWLGGAPAALAADQPSLKVIAPTAGQKITSTDIPVTVAVSNFIISPAHVGMPDQPGEGHIHVMLDGMNMGVLFNFYTAPTFTLLGEGIKPGQHKLVFDLASNTHEDIENTAQEVSIDYEPTNPQPAPASAAVSGAPEVKILSPADGATVGPQVTFQVQPANFTPSTGLEGKGNLKGYGHYHVYVDMNMASSSSGMMSMAGMVLMPGTNTFTVDLSAWPKGTHVVTVELVNNDHTPVAGSMPAMVTLNLGEAAAPASIPVTGASTSTSLILPIGLIVILVIIGGIVLWRSRAKPRAM
jgi:hypothetical protein